MTDGAKSIVARSELLLPEEIEFSDINIFSSKLLPHSKIGCFRACTVSSTYRGKTYKASGFGEGLLSSFARKKAQSEAIERLCLRILQEKGVETFRSSNGFSVHPDKTESVTRARNEVIERHEVITAWSERRGWLRIDVPLICSLLFSDLKVFRTKEWELSAYYIDLETEDFKSKETSRNFQTIVLFAHHKKLGFILESYRGPNTPTAWVKMTLNLKRIVCLYFEGFLRARRPQENDPGSHLSYFLSENGFRDLEVATSNSFARSKTEKENGSLKNGNIIIPVSSIFLRSFGLWLSVADEVHGPLTWGDRTCIHPIG